MKHAFKREYVDKALRDALMRLKVNTGVHKNYSAMVRSVVKEHPTDISLATLRGWLKAWCEKSKQIPQYYSPHEVKKVRKADFPRSSPPEPQFNIFQDEPVASEQPRPATLSMLPMPPICLSIKDGSEVMIHNIKQVIVIRSINGVITIEQA
jgi:hypothetical protein